MKVKYVEDKIRDLINDIRVMQQEEDDNGCQKVLDDAAKDIVLRLEEIAVVVGKLK
ncbi:MAG: hypothetical protein Q8R37_05490 [Nanoarchaeota archaeon]|nr:hypothetical protein [Nanoarchaeota archaeon]